MKYAGLFTRLTKATYEPDNEQSCWVWKGKIKARYPRCNIRNDEGEHQEIRPHRAMLVLIECDGEWEHFWQLYVLYTRWPSCRPTISASTSGASIPTTCSG